MKFTRLIGLAGALAVAAAVAQETAPVSPVPETVPAPAVALPDAGLEASAGDATAGQAKAAVCGACHGMDGNATDPQYPKLAGQHERYIARQLALFKNGGRQNAIMLGFATTLSPQDMRDLGAYFAQQTALPGVADDTVITSGPNQGRKFYEVGERIYRAGKADGTVPACTACHGPAGRGNPGPAYPNLAGQHAAYTAAALTAFRDGMVWGQDVDANAVMAGVAANLTDEEIQALATYVEGLHRAGDAK